MTMAKAERALDNFGQALARLDEAMALPEGDVISRDAVILRFVLVFETAWQCLRKVLELHQIQARYPRETFQRAYQAGWLDQEQLWLDMIDNRNLIAHTYKEATAIRVYDDVKRFLPLLRRLHAELEQRLDQRP